MSDRMVVEVARRGRFFVGEPFFMPGVPIPLDRRGLEAVEPGHLAVVTAGRRGRMRLERTLGPADRIETVLEGLLEQESVLTEFEPHRPPAASLQGRVDLREELCFTIDPETAKDFDDAVAVRREGDGYRAWVHIADVSHFVPAGSPLDHGAAERAFSVYIPGRVAPMLPPELSNDLCSLRPREDRLCVTVEVPFDAGFEPGEPAFYRSVIRSRERLTYGRAERILRGEEKIADEIAEGLRLAETLALELRRRRFARGALRITTREIQFAFDGDGGVERAWLESEPHAHMLVEELMILANEAVGGLLAGRRREAMYRVHERPDPQAVSFLLAKLGDLEVPTPPAPERERLTAGLAAKLAAETSERVSAYVEESGRGREAFPALVLRALKQARYDAVNLGHSGLASPAYGHFTSPIRRYPDLVVHRALLRELGVADDPPPEDLGGLAEHASTRERAYADIEYRADDVCLAWLLEAVLFERGWEERFEGEINGVIGSGLFVRFGEVFEGYVPVRRLGGDYYELNELATALAGRRTKRTFRLGDPIEVVVAEVNRSEGKIELRPAGSDGR
ncbi:MAG TPA: RNB domain-containing ribonuclease [Gaiellaceae bacterium]|nr:RNB domain-containing ribonuclease [Gaiellaceae bacterium]